MGEMIVYTWSLFLALIFMNGTSAQQAGTVSSEVHPLITTQKCTKAAGCTVQTSKVVLDANWRWLHGPAPSYTNCYSGSSWSSTLCPDPDTCAKNCALDGAAYSSTYGITTSGNNITMLLFPSSGSVGSRLYLMSDDSHYQLFNLKNQEISFDVDVSGLPCGANGALYFTNMAADGGSSLYPQNAAGAAYGTGYCDAQCPQDIKFINGQANMLNWNPSSNTGLYGSCCHEMDIWEANSNANTFTAHPCSVLGQTRCSSQTSNCGVSGICDQGGCDFNTYRLGNKSFYGTSGTVSTLPGKMRVITQFITSDGTAKGNLTQIVRSYIRGGQYILNANSNVQGVSGNSITDSFCSSEKIAFGETNTFAAKGGLRSMDSAMSLGMVLTFSVWVDYAQNMLWLDSNFPRGASPTQAGVPRGPCPTNSGDPSAIKAGWPNSQVVFSNIKWGDIGTTFGPPYP